MFECIPMSVALAHIHLAVYVLVGVCIHTCIRMHIHAYIFT
jgi:hypothetical protein